MQLIINIFDQNVLTYMVRFTTQSVS